MKPRLRLDRGWGNNHARHRLIIFDGDDTLWQTQTLYERAKDAIADTLAHDGLPAEEWRRALPIVDQQNVAVLGYQRSRFPKSCVDAYEAVARDAGMLADPRIADRVHQLAGEVFTQPVVPLSDAREVLAVLGHNYQLALLTAGDLEVQLSRVKDASLGTSFSLICIVKEKTPAAFAAAASAMGVLHDDTWSVGNSLASDVNPALTLGMHAIWLRIPTWAHADRDVTPIAVCDEATRLRDILDVLP